jgi:hypothetical protein
MTNQINNKCIYCGSDSFELHHLYKRGTNPELKDEKENLVPLCNSCHRRTEEDMDFLRGLQEVFYKWKPCNLDLFIRAEHNLEMLEKGQVSVENLSPALSDNYLQLAGALYCQMSDEIALLECKYPKWLIANAKDKPINRLEIEWNATDDGQRIIYLRRKLKSLEKMQSNLRARLSRQEREWYLSKRI